MAQWQEIPRSCGSPAPRSIYRRGACPTLRPGHREGLGRCRCRSAPLATQGRHPREAADLARLCVRKLRLGTWRETPDGRRTAKVAIAVGQDEQAYGAVVPPTAQGVFGVFKEGYHGGAMQSRPLGGVVRDTGPARRPFPRQAGSKSVRVVRCMLARHPSLPACTSQRPSEQVGQRATTLGKAQAARRHKVHDLSRVRRTMADHRLNQGAPACSGGSFYTTHDLRGTQTGHSHSFHMIVAHTSRTYSDSDWIRNTPNARGLSIPAACTQRFTSFATLDRQKQTERTA